MRSSWLEEAVHPVREHPVTTRGDRPYRPTEIKTQLAGSTLIRDELGQP